MTVLAISTVEIQMLATSKYQQHALHFREKSLESASADSPTILQNDVTECLKYLEIVHSSTSLACEAKNEAKSSVPERRLAAGHGHAEEKRHARSNANRT
eukprot:3883061-Pleurochrysis_carterae.AAC.1